MYLAKLLLESLDSHGLIGSLQVDHLSLGVLAHDIGLSATPLCPGLEHMGSSSLLSC